MKHILQAATQRLVKASSQDITLFSSTLRRMGAEVSVSTRKNTTTVIAQLPADHQLKFSDGKPISRPSEDLKASFRSMGYSKAPLGPQSSQGNGGMFMYEKWVKGSTSVIIGTQPASRSKSGKEVLVAEFTLGA